MFIGHYAPALLLAVDRRSPRLGTLFLAAQLVDVAFFVLVLLGVEHFRLVPGFTTTNALDLYDMRFTHSLLGTFGFAAAFALVWRLRRGSAAAAWIGALVVSSHWLLDYLVHVPDLTIAGAGYRYGLGLWNHPLIEMPLELAITAIALTYYHNETRPTSAQGTWSLGLLVAAMLAFQAIDWLGPKPTTFVDPPPASLPALALFAYAVLTALAWWVGATRETSAGPRADAG